MNGLNQMNDSEGLERDEVGKSLLERTNEILAITRADLSRGSSISVPVAQLSTLGAGVASLVPALRTVIQTTSIETQGLYRLANVGVNDALKKAKNGNFWGAFKTVEGKSKLVQLQEASPSSQTTTVHMPIDPATVMMAAALFSIEQQLGNIAEMEKQILSFLETEKESAIEADVETLSTIVAKYKFNWDNEHFVASNHKLVLDIQRTARKHMNSYQKEVSEVLRAKRLVVSQSKVNTALQGLLKKFKYYRLSLYTFSLASLLEIMLSGDFKEENIACIKTEIENLALAYRDIYGQCSLYLEKLSDSSLETSALKGLGAASKTVGKFIGSIPIVKEGLVDEFLQDSGAQLKKNAVGIEKKIVESFAEISNPEVRVFIEEMEDMIQIYGHTTDICFDENHIYLVAG
ncbi:hypothetical protein [Bittarella massiliensis (ex Durand et al. 2017)]|uniref:hypothetical protein n=1 Tax=Bittarella massiliensis (ex Durand et al. 2017) TaxID=1720313 RepID=UPI001FB5E057|nr:hypothetical protein [Bittarella massiliensis (ex Durand et al. 2017)]